MALKHQLQRKNKLGSEKEIKNHKNNKNGLKDKSSTK